MIGEPVAGVNYAQYSGVCNYACEHGYCPVGACTAQPEPASPPGGIFISSNGTVSQICNMSCTTGNSLTDEETWFNSEANLYLEYLLTNFGTQLWVNTFFEKVLNCGASGGGTPINCNDFPGGGCEGPDGGLCSAYCPPGAYFIHISIANLWTSLNKIYDQIQTMALCFNFNN